MSIHKKILQHHYEKSVSDPDSVNHDITNNNNSSIYNQTPITSAQNSLLEANNTQNNAIYKENILKWISQYNSSNNSIRLTTERLPRNEKMQRDLVVPLAAVIQPYCSNYNVIKNKILNKKPIE